MIRPACVRGVEGSDLSVASAANRMTLQIGNAVGIALVIAILGDATGHAIARADAHRMGGDGSDGDRGGRTMALLDRL